MQPLRSFATAGHASPHSPYLHANICNTCPRDHVYDDDDDDHDDEYGWSAHMGRIMKAQALRNNPMIPEILLANGGSYLSSVELPSDNRCITESSLHARECIKHSFGVQTQALFEGGK
eukprot:12089190-Karenia_brevis.AAC.1